MASNFGLIAGPLVFVTEVVGMSLPGCESAGQISETKQSKINAPGDSHQKGLDAISREDYDAAFSEWVPLAASGDSKAQYYLGVMYSQVVEEKDYKEAMKWYKRKLAELLNININDIKKEDVKNVEMLTENK